MTRSMDSRRYRSVRCLRLQRKAASFRSEKFLVRASADDMSASSARRLKAGSLLPAIPALGCMSIFGIVAFH